MHHTYSNSIVILITVIIIEYLVINFDQCRLKVTYVL